MGFCRKEPPIEDVFGSYNLEKKNLGKQTPPPPPLHPHCEIKEEAAEDVTFFH